MPSLLIASIVGLVVTAAAMTAAAVLVGSDWSDVRTAGWGLITVACSWAASAAGQVWLAGWRKGRALARRIDSAIADAYRGGPAVPPKHAWHSPSGPVPITPLPKPQPSDLY